MRPEAGSSSETDLRSVDLLLERTIELCLAWAGSEALGTFALFRAGRMAGFVAIPHQEDQLAPELIGALEALAHPIYQWFTPRATTSMD